MQIKSKKVFWLLVSLSAGTLSAEAIALRPSSEVIKAISQETITGRVVDQNGKPVAGATITVVGRSLTVLSDEKGSFSVSGSLNETLEVKYVGYSTTNFQIATLTGNEIVLNQQDEQIEEVLVSIGYQQVRKSDVTGAIASVQAEELNLSAPKLSQAMVGKV
ncbi:MAG: carboxypeptidase-like regulatory domain-containing protein, partial [Sphingobacteriaceae bacterium]